MFVSIAKGFGVSVWNGLPSLPQSHPSCNLPQDTINQNGEEKEDAKERVNFCQIGFKQNGGATRLLCV